MPSKSESSQQVIGRVALKLTALPAEDLQLVAELVDQLEEKRPVSPEKPVSAAEIREEARRRAELLRDVPREQLVARFIELGEQIRREAVARGTAVDGDLTGD